MSRRFHNHRSRGPMSVSTLPDEEKIYFTSLAHVHWFMLVRTDQWQVVFAFCSNSRESCLCESSLEFTCLVRTPVAGFQLSWYSWPSTFRAGSPPSPFQFQIPALNVIICNTIEWVQRHDIRFSEDLIPGRRWQQLFYQPREFPGEINEPWKDFEICAQNYRIVVLIC